MKAKFFAVIFLILLFGTASAQDMKPIQLPKPITDGGKPLMQCLKERHTSREFKSDALPPQVLSNLLWAAFGINRDDGHRTAPSAMNKQEVELYVALAEGMYLYDAKANTLNPVLKGDHRAACGKQDFVATAPVNLIYVADMAKTDYSNEEDKIRYPAADVGFIAENVYLFCASEGLATVVRGWVDREELAKVLKLRPEQKIILAQTVGYPKN